MVVRGMLAGGKGRARRDDGVTGVDHIDAPRPRGRADRQVAKERAVALHQLGIITPSVRFAQVRENLTRFDLNILAFSLHESRIKGIFVVPVHRD
jgi:hypothetical protein